MSVMNTDTKILNKVLPNRAETEPDPVEFQKPFCVPHLLIRGNRIHSASMTFPEFQWAISNSC